MRWIEVSISPKTYCVKLTLDSINWRVELSVFELSVRFYTTQAIDTMSLNTNVVLYSTKDIEVQDRFKDFRRDL